VRSERLPIIAMTAGASERERQRCLDAGMDDHVGKPFDPPDLIKTLNRWVRPRVQIRGIVHPTLKRDPRPEINGVPELPPFDLRAAMTRLSGNERLLRRIIRDFATNYEAGGQALQKLVESGAWSEIERFCHNLKSIAGTLGASKLAAAAEHVETACRDEQLVDIVALVATLGTHLAPAAAAAKSLPPSLEGLKELPDERVTSYFDRAKTASIAADLRQLLERRSMTARKRFVEFQAVATGHHVDAQLDAMATAVERLDIDEALRLMDGIATILELGEAA
jgi:two-component system sensor histidine kinase/response regulator